MSVNLPKKGRKEPRFVYTATLIPWRFMMKRQKRLRYCGCGELAQMRGFIFPTENVL
jgi:hypothetical protein